MTPIEQSLTDDGLCTVSEAGEILGIIRGQLYPLMVSGELRYCKLCKRRRVPRSALKASAANNTTFHSRNSGQEPNRTTGHPTRRIVVPLGVECVNRACAYALALRSPAMPNTQPDEPLSRWV